MGHKNKKSLIKQVEERLQSKMCIGRSKQLDKAHHDTAERIYSFQTFKNYQNCCCKFVTYCKEQHGAKNLEECHTYINEYLSKRNESCSAWTTKLDAAAIGKLYGESTTNYIPTKSRLRSEIVHNRRDAVRDKHFSEIKNSDFVTFCRATGLRRSELQAVRGSDLVACSSSPYGIGIHVRSGKGGKERIAPIYGNCSAVSTIKEMCETAGSNKIFERISSNANPHAYRAEYAATVYEANAREISTLQGSERYNCRWDKAGTVYDRNALLVASSALGHNRVCILSSSYLYNLDS